MSQIFFISILVLSQLFLASNSFADNSGGLNEDAANLLMEINKDSELKSSDATIDVESLGLDKVDVKSYDLPKKNYIAPKKDVTIAEPKKDNIPLVEEVKESIPQEPIDEIQKLDDKVNKDDINVDLEKLNKDSKASIPQESVDEPKKSESKINNDISAEVENKKPVEKKEPISPIVEEKTTDVVKKGLSSKVEGGSKETKVDELGTVSKIHDFLNRTTKILGGNEGGEKLAAEDKVDNKKQQDSHKLTISEEKQKKKLDKLNELRQKYLIKVDSKKPNQFYNKSDQDFLDDNSRIVPKKREFNKFTSYEIPAFPILDSYRTRDNFHIPKVVNRIDEIDILFESVAKGNDISYFKSAYAKVGNPNIKNRLGDTILTYAILLQRHSIVASILSAGADPDMPSGFGYTPLGIAIEVGDTISLKLLVNNNANIDYVDAFGRTYLMHASRSGFLPAVDLLVSKGIDINAMDNDGFTALSIAYRHKKDVIIKFLLKHGAQAWIEKPYDSSSQSLIKELNDRWKN